jgi:hypothetical protein
MHHSKTYFRGINAKPRRLQNPRGKAGEELVQAPVGIGIEGCLACSQSQVGTAEAAQERFQPPVDEQIPRCRPIRLTAQRQFIEVSGSPPAGENEGGIEGVLIGFGSAAGATAIGQERAIVVTIGRFGGIDSRATAACLYHQGRTVFSVCPRVHGLEPMTDDPGCLSAGESRFVDH